MVNNTCIDNLHPAIQAITDIHVETYDESTIFTHDTVKLSYRFILNRGWSVFTCPQCREFIFYEHTEAHKNVRISCEHCHWTGIVKPTITGKGFYGQFVAQEENTP